MRGDPKKVGEWFQLVKNMVATYGIQPEDIYNFDESGFAMGIVATNKVLLSNFICISYKKLIHGRLY